MRKGTRELRVPSGARRVTEQWTSVRTSGGMLVAFAIALAACASEPRAASVSITSPMEGDTVRGTAVHVMLESAGIELAPAADARAGTAHHHLILDGDLPTEGVPIPAGIEAIVHLGKAETDYHWEGLTAGQHRIIAVLADPAHVPLRPIAADTVTFVVVP